MGQETKFGGNLQCGYFIHASQWVYQEHRSWQAGTGTFPASYIKSSFNQFGKEVPPIDICLL